MVTVAAAVIPETVIQGTPAPPVNLDTHETVTIRLLDMVPVTPLDTPPQQCIPATDPME